MILTTIFVLLGIFEVVSNLFHLSHRSIGAIGISAKRQHQELPLDLDPRHFFVKAILMLVCGIIFLFAGAARFWELPFSAASSWSAVSLLGLYGFLQALVYRREPKVWAAMVVYNTPFALIAGGLVK